MLCFYKEFGLLQMSMSEFGKYFFLISFPFFLVVILAGNWVYCLLWSRALSAFCLLLLTNNLNLDSGLQKGKLAIFFLIGMEDSLVCPMHNSGAR